MEGSGQLHTPAALPPGKRPRYPLERRLGGPQNRSGRRVEEKIVGPTGTRTSTPLSRTLSLYRLCYPGSMFLRNVGTPLLDHAASHTVDDRLHCKNLISLYLRWEHLNKKKLLECRLVTGRHGKMLTAVMRQQPLYLRTMELRKLKSFAFYVVTSDLKDGETIDHVEGMWLNSPYNLHNILHYKSVCIHNII
jgi:hypothetical protein